MSTAARTPRVQLVLNLQEQEPQRGQRVLKVTAGHEVVEDVLNGVHFQFKRKRSRTPAAAAPSRGAAASTHKSQLLKTPAGQLMAATQAGTAVPAESPYADEVEVPRALGERLLQGVQALPERATAADRLLAFSSSICAASSEAAARRPGSAARAAALADIFQSFQAALAAALQDGSIQLAAPARPATPLADGDEVEQPDYQVDLAARKMGLRARLANFEKEEAEWQVLLEKVEQLDEHQLAAAAAGGEGEAVPEGEAAMAAAGAAVGGQGEQQAAEGELAALAQLHADVHRRLAMQVEGVCKLVGDVEEMVERANRSAAEVQNEYKAEKLRVFPHVDSPARLIRELVRGPSQQSQPAAGAAGIKAAAAVAAVAQQAAGGGKENAMEVA